MRREMRERRRGLRCIRAALIWCRFGSSFENGPLDLPSIVQETPNHRAGNDFHLAGEDRERLFRELEFDVVALRLRGRRVRRPPRNDVAASEAQALARPRAIKGLAPAPSTVLFSLHRIRAL